MKRTLAIYLVLIGVAIVQAAWYGPQLPETVASHFNAAGEADGWMARGVFVTFAIGTVVGTALLMAFAQSLVFWAPDSLVSMPNKAYWYAPERRDATRASIARYLAWFGSATLLLMLGVNQLAIQANLSTELNLGITFWVLLGAFLLFTAIWLMRMVLRFRRVPDAADGV
jgi:uncharacterized membrane protein